MNKILINDFKKISKFIIDINSLKNTKWLITGSTGMIGSYLLSFLSWINKEKLDRSIKITAFYRGEIDQNHPTIGNLFDKEFIEFRNVDLSRKFTLKDQDDYNFVFHGASNAAPKAYLSDPIGTINTNVRATQIFLDHFKDSNILKLFLYVSSGEVYGSPNIENIPTTENYIGITDNLSSRSCYVESKKFGETLCWNYFKQYNIPVKIIRPVHIFGPGFKPNDSRVWADFIIKTVSGKDIKILGDGLSRRSFCYIADAIVQIFAVIQKGEIGDVYNIGNEEHISIKELANIIATKSANKVNVIIRNKLPDYLKGSPQISCPSIQKVKALSPLLTTGLEKGIENSINWFIYYY